MIISKFFSSALLLQPAMPVAASDYNFVLFFRWSQKEKGCV
jgi:hypothetical protein